MNQHGRKYGEKESHPIPVWNGIFDHYEAIGSAVWVFLWCVDRVTDESDPAGSGLVLGGAPVKIERIVADIPGAVERTVRRHLQRLVANGFIRRKRTPYGAILSVLNSKKFGIWRSTKSGQNGQPMNDKPSYNGLTDRPILSARPASGGRYKEDKAVDTTVDTAAAAVLPEENKTAWTALGKDIPMGVPRFQKIFEHYFATRNGNPLSDAMERTIQMANKQGVKVPKPFFDAKRIVERRETEDFISHLREADALPELEDLPWCKK